ncbi:adenine phosphoribosyltransferase [Flavobacterium psychrophilum]|nr:adenine phosphoribosyltransferase [Flavobacterium psychrophilum]
MKKNIDMYKIIAKLNKIILPSFSKQRLDLAKAKKWQMAIIGYRYFVTKKALES